MQARKVYLNTQRQLRQAKTQQQRGRKTQQLDTLRATINSLNEPCSTKNLDFELCHTYDKNWLGEKYVIIDNEDNGDCFFGAIRNAYILSGKAVTVPYLRGLLVTDEAKVQEYKDLLSALGDEEIKSRKLNKEVLGNLEKFKEFILSSDYWADEWAIQQISDGLELSIVIMRQDRATTCQYLDYKDVIILEYSETSMHYRLIGYDGKFMFNRDSGSVPPVITECNRNRQMPRKGTVRFAKQALGRPTVLPQRKPIETGVDIEQLKKRFLKKKAQALELTRRGRNKLSKEQLKKLDTILAELKSNEYAAFSAQQSLKALDAALAEASEENNVIKYMSAKQQKQSGYMQLGGPQQKQSEYMQIVGPKTQAQQQQAKPKAQQQQAKPKAQQARSSAQQQARKAQQARKVQQARKAQQARLTAQAQNKRKAQQQAGNKSATQPGVFTAVTNFLGLTPPVKQQIQQRKQPTNVSLAQQLAKATAAQQQKNILTKAKVEEFIMAYYANANNCYYLGEDKSGIYCPTTTALKANQQAQKAQAQRKAKKQAQQKAQIIQQV